MAARDRLREKAAPYIICRQAAAGWLSGDGTPNEIPLHCLGKIGFIATCKTECRTFYSFGKKTLSIV
jgi:hypothetical protein